MLIYYYRTICHCHLLHMPNLFLREAEKTDDGVRERTKFVLHLNKPRQ